MSEQIVIIGAGVIGCSIARALACDGYRVTVVDRLPAPGYGSTSASSAIVRPFYTHTTSAAIAHESRFRWLDWPQFLGEEDDAGMARYVESGGLVLFVEGEIDRYADNLTALQEVGADFRILSADEVAGLYPGVSTLRFGPPVPFTDEHFAEPTRGGLQGGIFMPAAGYVSDPQLAAHNLSVAASAAGAQFRFNQRVTAINRTDQKVTGVSLAGGLTLEADIVMNVGGPGSSMVNELAGVELPITTRAHRHEVAYVRAPSGYTDNGNGFLVDLDSGFYLRPDGNDMVIGTADPPCDQPDVVDANDFNTSLTDHWTRQVYRAAQRFPRIAIETPARGVVGLYDVSDDWIPVYDKTDLDGYYVAIGTSGNQFKNAPVVGDMMLAIVAQRREGKDHDREPAVVALPNVGRTVDLSFFSRNRTVQHTNSVLA